MRRYLEMVHVSSPFYCFHTGTLYNGYVPLGACISTTRARAQNTCSPSHEGPQLTRIPARSGPRLLSRVDNQQLIMQDPGYSATRTDLQFCLHHRFTNYCQPDVTKQYLLWARRERKKKTRLLLLLQSPATTTTTTTTIILLPCFRLLDPRDTCLLISL